MRMVDIDDFLEDQLSVLDASVVNIAKLHDKAAA